MACNPTERLWSGSRSIRYSYCYPQAVPDPLWGRLACNSMILAEREGFEPPVRLRVQLISSQPEA